jgi:hypothetical protein
MHRTQHYNTMVDYAKARYHTYNSCFTNLFKILFFWKKRFDGLKLNTEKLHQLLVGESVVKCTTKSTY